MQLELVLRLIALVSIIGATVVNYSQYGFMRSLLTLALGCLLWGVFFWSISARSKT